MRVDNTNTIMTYETKIADAVQVSVEIHIAIFMHLKFHASEMVFHLSGVHFKYLLYGHHFKVENWRGSNKRVHR